MNATYTHTGRRAAVGYQHTGRDFNHYEKKPGRIHALNRGGYRSYMAVCGVVVTDDSTDCHDPGGKNDIALAIEYPKVTCKACLKCKPVAIPVPKVTKFVVMLEGTDGEIIRWSSDTSRDRSEQYADGIQRAGRASITQPPGYVTRAWVEQIEE